MCTRKWFSLIFSFWPCNFFQKYWFFLKNIKNVWTFSQNRKSCFFLIGKLFLIQKQNKSKCSKIFVIFDFFCLDNNILTQTLSTTSMSTSYFCDLTPLTRNFEILWRTDGYYLKIIIFFMVSIELHISLHVEINFLEPLLVNKFAWHLSWLQESPLIKTTTGKCVL